MTRWILPERKAIPVLSILTAELAASVSKILGSTRGKAWGDRPNRSLGDLMLDYLTATQSKITADRDAYSAQRLLGFFGQEQH